MLFALLGYLDFIYIKSIIQLLSIEKLLFYLTS